MKEQLITFETAKLAKERGYEPIIFFTNGKGDEILGIHTAPIQSLLQKWLRENFNIDISVIWWEKGYLFSVEKRPHKGNHYKLDVYYDTYEEALERGLQEALKLITNERH